MSLPLLPRILIKRWQCRSLVILSNPTEFQRNNRIQLPSVLWRCWLGGRKGIRPVKKWAVGCWHGYLSGARCRLAYVPADATSTHCLLATVKSRLVLLFWYWLTRVVPEKGPLTGCVCVCVTEIQWQWVNSAAWIEISWPEKTVAAFTTSLLPSVIVKFFPKSLSMIMLFWAPFWLTACNGLRSASSWRQYIKIRTKIQQHWLQYDTQVASWQFLHRRWPLMSSIQHQHSTTQKHNPVLISFRS